jgi:hypothetical protein
MRKTLPRKWFLVLAGILALALTLAMLVVVYRPRIIVKVENVGHEQLHAVVVHVTGKSYLLGDIPSGGQTSVEVHPSSESHVEIEFADREETTKRLNAGGYFEAYGYEGTVAIKANSQGLVDVQQDVRPTMIPWP